VARVPEGRPVIAVLTRDVVRGDGTILPAGTRLIHCTKMLGKPGWYTAWCGSLEPRRWIGDLHEPAIRWEPDDETEGTP